MVSIMDRISIESVRDDQIQNYICCFSLSLSDELGKLVYFCRVDACVNSYVDKSGAIKHLRVHHKNVYTAIRQNKNDFVNAGTEKTETFDIRVKVNLMDIRNACVDLIVFHAMPLCAVEYPAFKRILQPYLTALERQGINLAINIKNMKDLIDERSDAVRQVIKKEVQNRLVCLMIDIATRYNRSLLGVSIAFRVDGQTNIRTIGMHILRISHTGKNISDIVKQNLSEFDISLSQVLSVTSDNGKNIVKSIALLDAHYQESMSNDLNSSCSSESDEGDESESDEAIDGNIFDHNYYSDLLTNARSAFDHVEYTDLILGISCAAHCINLVVRKGIDNCQTTLDMLTKCRSLSKKLRTPTFRNIMKDKKLKMAQMDQETRWNSIYRMVIP